MALVYMMGPMGQWSTPCVGESLFNKALLLRGRHLQLFQVSITPTPVLLSLYTIGNPPTDLPAEPCLKGYLQNRMIPELANLRWTCRPFRRLVHT